MHRSQGFFCKTIIVYLPLAHCRRRRGALLDVAVPRPPRAPLPALSLAPVPLHPLRAEETLSPRLNAAVPHFSAVDERTAPAKIGPDHGTSTRDSLRRAP